MMKSYAYTIGLNKEELRIYHKEDKYYYYTNLSDKIFISKKTLRHYLRNCKWFTVRRVFEDITRNEKLLASKTLVAKTYENGKKVSSYVRKIGVKEKIYG